MSEITCPECGCHLHLEWKTNKEIEKEDCCEMPKEFAKSKQEVNNNEK